jgi:hypothetical protein
LLYQREPVNTRMGGKFNVFIIVRVDQPPITSWQRQLRAWLQPWRRLLWQQVWLGLS